MKKTKRNLWLFVIMLYLLTLFVGCSNKKVEQHKIQYEDLETNHNALIEAEPISRIGEETLQYPGKTEEFEYLVYETYVAIDRYIGNASEVIVPEKLENLPVKVVDGFYYNNNESIKKITLPESIVIIENAAFQDCFALEEINIPEGVTKIGSDAFESCISLSSLTIPKNVTEIGDNAFGISHINRSYKAIENFTAKVYKGSEAIKYIANESHDINYEIIDK